MIPTPGTVGAFSLKMYRGQRAADERLQADFASDPGEYGCGTCWTDDAPFAAHYGDVVEKQIVLDRVYHIPRTELTQLIAEYRTCRMEDGKEKRREGAERLTHYFLTKGYQGVLTIGYETVTAMGLCVFGDKSNAL